MKKPALRLGELIKFTGIICILISCGPKNNEVNTEDKEIDLDNLSFCDCKNNRFNIDREITIEKDPEAKKELEAELSLFDEKCKKI